ncbi:MAG: putative lipopolysaccharide heptosyltransferase III [Deltaproteobacteria bacterium]|nr:putative lipopolysaccharide heptosyltransferase III [Deltaproteobacteria bacterium]MBN2846037.1 putative lipopolysaccharide heptosyltransferase III [Deltaproteobacteria bacterium]
MKKEIKEILVIKLRYLGDVVLTTPVFESLRQFYPQASITALVNKGTETMLVKNPNVDRIFVLERDKNHIADLKKQLSLIAKLRKLRFDLALELTNNDRGAAYSFLSAAKRRLGYRPKRIKILDRHLLFTDLVKTKKGLHIVDRHLEMIRHLKSDSIMTAPALFWSKEEELMCRKIFEKEGASFDEQFAVIHPTLHAKYRKWNIVDCSLLCDYLFNRWKVRPILICGPTAEEMDFTKQVSLKANSPVINLGGQLTLRQLIALIANAILYVGIDSGPMHIAAALKIPVVAIFGPQEPRRWGPWGEGHMVVQKSWECVPCRKKGCDDKGTTSLCLEKLTVEEVIPAIDLQMRKIESVNNLEA